MAAEVKPTKPEEGSILTVYDLESGVASRPAAAPQHIGVARSGCHGTRL